MVGRLRQICLGIGIDADSARAYRELWLSRPGAKPPPAPPPAPPPCPHLWKRVRDEAGAVKTRWCATG